MKKVTFFLSFICLYGSEINAQWAGIEVDVLNNWGPTTRVDALGDDGGLIFYGGATPVDTNGQTIINGFLLSTYSQGVAKNRLLVNSVIYSVVHYQGDTILAGGFDNVRSIDSFPAIEAYIDNIMVLNNGSMEQLGEGFDASCRAKVIGDYLYIFGWFGTAMGDSCNVVRWDGQQWETIGPPLLASHHEIADITYYNDELYIAGNIIMDNGLQDILVLRDGEWQVVGEPIETGLSRFNKLVVYNGELYAAGDIRKTDGFAGNMIQRWNGEMWQELGNSLYSDGPSSSSQIFDMEVHEDYLYVSGHFYSEGWPNGMDIPGIARWDGSQWCGLFTQGVAGAINSFAFTGGELYVREPFYGIPAGNPAFIYRYTMGNEVFPCSEVFTGLNDEAEVVVSLNPNPTSSHLTLTSPLLLPGTHITAYNLTGQQVYGRQLQQTYEQLTIDARQFGPAGLYLLHIQMPGQAAVVKKVVVQE